MKKLVKYNLHKKSTIVVGKRAIVWPIDHPNCTNMGPAITSKVVSIGEDGRTFETENTNYCGSDQGA